MSDRGENYSRVFGLEQADAPLSPHRDPPSAPRRPVNPYVRNKKQPSSTSTSDDHTVVTPLPNNNDDELHLPTSDVIGAQIMRRRETRHFRPPFSETPTETPPFVRNPYSTPPTVEYPPPRSSPIQSATANLANLIKTGRAINRNITAEREHELQHATNCSKQYNSKGYNLHKRFVKTLSEDENLKYLTIPASAKKQHPANNNHTLEKFFDVIGGKKTDDKYLIYNRCLIIVITISGKVESETGRLYVRELKTQNRSYSTYTTLRCMASVERIGPQRTPSADQPTIKRNQLTMAHQSAAATAAKLATTIKTKPISCTDDLPPILPTLDKHTCEKPHKTIFNKFKIKISFTVPREDEIKPRDKFATLFSVFQRQHDDTTLEQ